MRLLEDMLSASERLVISAVLRAQTARFDLLVDIAQLNRSLDFRHADLSGLNFCEADLRGFDFTGSDLRGCLRNSGTIFDHTTILIGAKLDWLDVEDLPIVQQMQKVEAARKSNERIQAIEDLISRNGRTIHVTKFIVFAALRSETVDQFLDFLSFLPRDIELVYRHQLRDVGVRLLDKRLGRSRNRSGKGRLSSVAVDSIAEQLTKRTDSLSGEIFYSLAKSLSANAKSRLPNGVAIIEAEDLRHAFQSLSVRK